MQTWYDRPRPQVEKLVTALYNRIAWAPQHQGLQQYLDFLAGQHENAFLVQDPLPPAEIQFWQGQIDLAVQLLGPLQVPVSDWKLRNRSALYLPFLHHALFDIRLTLIADAHGYEQQKCFDLVPQIDNKAHFIQVRSPVRTICFLQAYKQCLL